MIEGHDRVWAEVDLDAVRFNMESMRKNLKPGTKIVAVLKTDGYGHGAVAIAKGLEPLDYIWGYATATYEEAMELRHGGLRKPILILGYTFPYCYEDLVNSKIRPAVFREDQLKELGKTAWKLGRPVIVHIAVDTSMSRIGIAPDDEGLEFVRKALETPGVQVEGIFTHFSRADEKDPEHTQYQVSVFRSFAKRIWQELGYRVPFIHCSNSAGIISFPEANMDLVRAGVTIYGMWPSEEVPKDIVPLKPALQLFSHVTFVKTVPSDTPVSYGGTFVTTRETKIATIPCGYGDGYPRSLSNKGHVLLHGQKAPILGRVCMDQFMVDVTDIPGVKEDDVATLIGRDGDEEITMESIGDISGRFNYEFACDIGKRVPRIYRNECPGRDED